MGRMKIELARNMKANRVLLAMVFQVDTQALTDMQIARMAQDWVENETVTVAGKTYDYHGLRQQIESFVQTMNASIPEVQQKPPQQSLTMRGNLDAGVMVDRFLPRSESFVFVARQVSESVRDESGPWYKKLWYAVKGFFSWIIGSFRGDHRTLTEHIYAQAANGMANDLEDRLRRARYSRSELAVLLTDENVAQFRHGIEQGVQAVGKGAGPQPVTTEGIAQSLANVNLRSITVGGVTLNEETAHNLVRRTVSNRIRQWLHAYGGIEGSVMRFLLDDPKRLDRISNAVGDALVDSFRDSTDDVLGDKKRLADDAKRKVRQSLEKSRAEWVTGTLALMPDMAITKLLAKIENQIGEYIEQGYETHIIPNLWLIRSFRQQLSTSAHVPPGTVSLTTTFPLKDVPHAGPLVQSPMLAVPNHPSLPNRR